jgi:hypothetical protein
MNDKMSEVGTAPRAALYRCPKGGSEMAKRIENECAFCAEEIIEGEEVVGKDWKVYCSELCAEAGEKMSLEEWRKAMGNGEQNGEWGVETQEWGMRNQCLI